MKLYIILTKSGKKDRPDLFVFSDSGAANEYMRFYAEGKNLEDRKGNELEIYGLDGMELADSIDQAMVRKNGTRFMFFIEEVQDTE
jgi:hypothetical protein